MPSPLSCLHFSFHNANVEDNWRLHYPQNYLGVFFYDISFAAYFSVKQVSQGYIKRRNLINLHADREQRGRTRCLSAVEGIWSHLEITETRSDNSLNWRAAVDRTVWDGELGELPLMWESIRRTWSSVSGHMRGQLKVCGSGLLERAAQVIIHWVSAACHIRKK